MPHMNRPRQAAPAERGPSPGLGHLKLAAAGLAIGVFATVAFTWFNLSGTPFWSLLRSNIGMASNGHDFSGPRIGRAATAPVLALCLNRDPMNISEGVTFGPDMMLTVLRASELQGRITRSTNSPREHAVLELAQIWGEVADCVYNQDAYRLCDIDNRALAVEAGGTFIRQADSIIAKPEKTYAAKPGELDALRSTRDRVLSLMQNRVQNGVLIASDFPSSFAPQAVRATLNGAKTLRNDCKKGKQS